MAEIHHTTMSPTKLELLTSWLPAQRWYAGKGATPVLRPLGGYRLDDPAGKVGIEVIVVADDSGPSPVAYQVPLTYRGVPLEGAEDALVGTSEHGVLGKRWVYDGPHDPVFAAQLIALVQGEAVARAQSESHTADPLTAGHRVGDQEVAVTASRVLSGEQSNTSIICDVADGAPVIVKVFRTLHEGENPDVVVQSALTEAGSTQVPRTVGAVEGHWHDPATGDEVRGHLAFAQEFLPGVEDAWRVALRAAQGDVDFTTEARELGVATAEIHRTLAATLGTELATPETRQQLLEVVRARQAAALEAYPPLAAEREQIDAVIAELGTHAWPDLQRVHGDYHLGQVLRTPTGWVAVDFEGEPLRPLTERVRPDLALRDVAGMLRSFDYAGGSVELADPSRSARAWVDATRAAFLDGYLSVAAPQEERASAALEVQPVLRALELDKALYEVVYEARNRPTWLGIPTAAVHRLVSDSEGTSMKTVQTTAEIGDQGPLEAFLEGRNGQPHDFLGHHVGPGGLTITVFRPLAQSVRARLADGTILELGHVRGGVWTATAPDVTSTSDYRLLVAYDDGVEHEQDDPYRFAPTLGEMDRYLFNEGRHEKLWEVLGSHVREYAGPLGTVSGVSFAVWAPRAEAVHVIGDFNGWDRISHPMRALGGSGVWELFVPGAAEGMNYQYAIRGKKGHVVTHTDPMARRTEVAPKTAAIVTESHYTWADQAWMTERAAKNPHAGPMSIYEVHLGSWRQGSSYVDLAEHLVNYVKDLGFTHVELLPVMEHPYVPSWGYHVTGYYAPTSRFGSPDDFRYLVDRLHQNGIGVILDWVPGHFATDEWALARFDGQPLYEHPDPRKGWHPEWGSFIFDLGRPEVRNFLVANALYWFEEFHVDGIRVDGVASMLYLDYSRQPGEWIPNAFGGRENLDAVQLLQEVNATAYGRVPGVVTIAEESTSWDGVTRGTDTGGLGFGFKWNMGWMNDALRYLGQDPIFRQYHHNSMTFALMYAFSENFVLPISHDEVVHGKGSLLRKSRGTRDEQLATLRAFLAYMWTHPGKQLIFMGCEFAQESEWADGRSLDWWLLDQPAHYRVHAQVKEMNALYKDHRALWELDTDAAGFRWLNADDAAANTFSYLRFGKGEHGVDAPVVAVIVNFSGATHESYRIGLPRGGGWRVVLDTAGYRPEAPSSAGTIHVAESSGWDGQPYAVNLVVPALSTVWLIPEETVASPTQELKS